MLKRLNFFQKMILFLVLLLSPMLGLYYYSTEKSIEIIQSQLIGASLNKLELFMVQLEASINNFEMVSTPLLVDTNVLEYQYNLSFSEFSMLQTKSLIQEKLSLSTITGNWRNYVTLYFPGKGDYISNDPNVGLDERWLHQNFSLEWHYANDPKKGPVFTRYFINQGASPDQPQSADLVMEISLHQWSFENLLDSYKTGNEGDPFFYKDGYPIIQNRSADTNKIAQAVRSLPRQTSLPSGHLIESLSGQKYVISYYKSARLGWYLVDYLPLDRIVQPIERQRTLFGTTSILILISGIGAAFLLYRNIQIPIIALVRGVKHVKRGDYTYRLKIRGHNEFSYLMQNYNEMAEQIRHLIDTEFRSRLQARDATLKQLQAQIHPHFLYNCLGFIINMTKMHRDNAVMDMAYHLADYYRYSTRMDNQGVSLKEEIDFITLYLEINRLRKDVLTYTIDLPEEWGHIRVPRLLIQPLVENALVHGLEGVEHPGEVVIQVYASMGRLHIEVEDNGKGMPPDELANLQASLRISAEDFSGCGLWNVNQRMLHHFGSDSFMVLEASEWNGLKVSLVWNLSTNGGETNGGEKDV